MARVIELFVLNPGRRFTLSQIVDELNLSISTVHSILTTLTGRRWLERAFRRQGLRARSEIGVGRSCISRGNDRIA